MHFGSACVDNSRRRHTSARSRGSRSAPQRPFRARRSSPALIHQHSDSPSTGGRADRRILSNRLESARPRGRGTCWDGGSIPCVLALPGANAMANALAFPFCSTLCSTGESVRARARTPPLPMTHEVHARASRDARVAARLEERRRVLLALSRDLRGKLCVNL